MQRHRNQKAKTEKGQRQRRRKFQHLNKVAAGSIAVQAEGAKGIYQV